MVWMLSSLEAPMVLHLSLSEDGRACLSQWPLQEVANICGFILVSPAAGCEAQTPSQNERSS